MHEYACHCYCLYVDNIYHLLLATQHALCECAIQLYFAFSYSVIPLLNFSVQYSTTTVQYSTVTVQYSESVTHPRHHTLLYSSPYCTTVSVTLSVTYTPTHPHIHTYTQSSPSLTQSVYTPIHNITITICDTSTTSHRNDTIIYSMTHAWTVQYSTVMYSTV